MPDTQSNRRLAAILAADVVGYSRMMGADEMGTLSALKDHRESLFEPAVERNNGRTFKLMGDGTLVEFASVVDAVRCALEIQQNIAAAVEAEAPGSSIVLRIGVNLGDVIFDGDDVYGDGVNVAARLEPLAEPGGICVSSIVNESVSGRIEVKFSDGGAVQVKNIERPVRIWKWAPGNGSNGSGSTPSGRESAQSTAQAPATPSAKCSIAVLPFDNMSHDPEQEYFSDGISEDIITDLSKVSGLMVIARNSSFTYKGKSVDLRTVGRELGVRSVLEGSIRKAGNRVRITAQLIDAESGGHIWADRYDRDLTDIFEVQDEVTREIVGALKIALTPSDEKRLAAVPTSNTEAHDLFLRGRELMTAALNKETFPQAEELFLKAIELDPDYADAYAGLAMSYGFDHINRWSDHHETSLEKARKLATKAIELNPDEPFAHYVMSVALGIGGDREGAKRETAKALELNPNYAPAHNSKGVFQIFEGDPAAAIPHIEEALRLDPGAGQQYLHFLAMAHLLLGNYETAAASFRERIIQVPETDLSRSLLASTLGYMGENDEARRVWDEIRSVNPDYSVQQHMDNLASADEAMKEKLTGGLKLAGLID